MTRTEHITLKDCAPEPIECVCEVTTYAPDLRVQRAPEVRLVQIHTKDAVIYSQSEWMDYVKSTQHGYTNHSTFGQIQDACEDRINSI